VNRSIDAGVTPPQPAVGTTAFISEDELDLTTDEADGQIAHAFRREIC
jgi:hypothetical protein